jgi:hypothetical protein
MAAPASAKELAKLGGLGIGVWQHHCLRFFDGSLGVHELLLAVRFYSVIRIIRRFLIFPNEARQSILSNAR